MTVTKSVNPPSYLDISLTTLRQAGYCGCGRALQRGERAGVTHSAQEPVCLPCVKRSLWDAVEGDAR